ncbi:PKD domain-containing protein [Ornithobacterium rhinotracheale]
MLSVVAWGQANRFFDRNNEPAENENPAGFAITSGSIQSGTFTITNTDRCTKRRCTEDFWYISPFLKNSIKIGEDQASYNLSNLKPGLYVFVYEAHYPKGILNEWQHVDWGVRYGVVYPNSEVSYKIEKEKENYCVGDEINIKFKANDINDKLKGFTDVVFYKNELKEFGNIEGIKNPRTIDFYKNRGDEINKKFTEKGTYNLYFSSIASTRHITNKSNISKSYIKAEGDLQTLSFEVYDKPSNFEILTGNTLCGGGDIEIEVGAKNATNYEFYKNENATVKYGSNGNTLVLSPDEYKIGQNTIWVRAVNDHCRGDLKKFTFNVVERPENLVISGQTSYCLGSEVLVKPSAANAQKYEWSEDPNFNDLLGSDYVNSKGELNFISSKIETKTFYVRAINKNGCATLTEKVVVNIDGGISQFSVQGSEQVCKGDDVVFEAGAVNNGAGNITYTFYKNKELTIPYPSNGNQLVIRPENYILGKNKFWVTASNPGGCTTAAKEVTFTVFEKPENLVIDDEWGTNFCVGQRVRIPVSAKNVSGYEWSTDPNFNTILNEDYVNEKGELDFTATRIESKTYYVRAKGLGSCSISSSIKIKVNGNVTNLSVTNNNAKVCQGNPITFEAGAVNNGTGAIRYNFYKNRDLTVPYPSNGNSVTLTDEEYELGQNTLWVTASNDGGCESDPVTITFYVLEGLGETEVIGQNQQTCLGGFVDAELRNSNNNVEFEWFTDYLGNQPLNPAFISQKGRMIHVPSDALGSGYKTLYYKAKNAGGCASEMGTLSVQINAAPGEISVPKPTLNVCLGADLHFEVAGTGVKQYLWFKNEELTLPVEEEYIISNRLTLNSSDLGIGTFKYYVVGENASGCRTNKVEVTINVTNKPSLSSIIGETKYCQNQMVHLELVNTDVKQFEWYKDPNMFVRVDPEWINANGSVLSFKATKLGETTLYYRAVNDSGCASDLQSVSFEVTEAPTNISINGNNEIYCSSEELEIVAGATGVTEFEWYEDEIGSIKLNEEWISGTTLNRLHISNLKAGTYTYYVRARNASGCTTDLLPFTFTVFDAPQFNGLSTSKGNSQFTFDEQIVLNIDASNYDGYRIYKNNVQVVPRKQGEHQRGNISTYEISAHASLDDEGTYRIELVNAGRCSVEKEIGVFVLPPIRFLHNRENEITNVDGQQKIKLQQHDMLEGRLNVNRDIFTYRWDFGDGFTNVGTKAVHYYNIPGEYNISVQMTNKKTGDVSIFNYPIPVLVTKGNQIVNVDITPTPFGTINIFPNPVKDQMNIKFVDAKFNSYTARIYDLNGLTVFVERFNISTPDETYTFSNPLMGVKTGTYILVLTEGNTENVIKTFKIIKQ